MLVVAAIVKAIKGKEEELEKELRKLVPLARGEEGTISYIAHRSVDDPCKFLVYEKYRSKEDFDFHTSTPHFKAFFEAVGPILDGEPEITTYYELE